MVKGMRHLVIVPMFSYMYVIKDYIIYIIYILYNIYILYYIYYILYYIYNIYI